MSYRAGTRGLEAHGIADGEPRIICDECGYVLIIGGFPPRWFLDGKPKPGWAKAESSPGRSFDVCPACVKRLLAELKGAA